MFHDKTKNIDVRFHYICDTVDKGIVKLDKIHTDSNLANMCTKCLPVENISLIKRF